MEVYSVQKSREEWRQARQTAFIQDVLGAFAERPAELLPFEVIRQKLQLRNARYRGLEDVPLERIVGSVGRTEDFTRAFFPRREALGQRWQKVDQLALSATGLSPVELYKVGDIYFVRDGNHRVSVAKQHEAKTIQAYVTEYPVRVSLDPDVDMADLLTKAAHESFLEQTQLDKLCPDTPIELSYPDGYDDLLNEIATFQDIIASIDEREIPFEEAVALWCEMRYAPIAEIIRSREIMNEFPDRTEADLYLWLRRSQEELRVRYGVDPPIEDTVTRLVRRFRSRPSLLKRARNLAGRPAEKLTGMGQSYAVVTIEKV